MSKKKAESRDEIPFAEKAIIYEINTFIWLRELSLKYGKKTNLATIPSAEWDEISGNGFSAVWLMGVWERSDAGKVIAKQHSGIMHDLKEALPDLEEEDITGSPYCIKDYQVDARLGGAIGLANARKEMARRGMRLILDFVPNHVAPDHPWTISRPEFFIAGTAEAMLAHPDDYYLGGDHIFARARDPFYPPWPDVLQLNVFNKGLRDAIINTLNDIASQCDGIRCDMAMLVMNDIFARTWGDKAGHPPQTDFWSIVIPAVKKKYPEFSFIAESYWDTEPALINQGFDFCYDKKYYDFLKENAGKALNHILKMEPYQQKLLRFLENHDEPRAAALFGTERSKAMALASLTLPGARLLHDGQLEGRKVKVPVFLSRRQEEDVNEELKQFYLRLIKLFQSEAIVNGKWAFCPVSGWTDNQTCRNILAWEWLSDQENLLIVINLSNEPAQGLVRSSYPYLSGRTYQLFDVLNGELYRRDGNEMNDQCLYVVLKAWGIHTMSIEH